MRRILAVLSAVLLSTAFCCAQSSNGGGTARRIQAGASLPAKCAVGDVFFKSTSPIGTQQCTATNTWAVVGGGIATAAAGSDKQVQFNDGGTAFGGDAGFTFDKATEALSVGSATASGSLTLAGKTSGSTAISVDDSQGILTLGSSVNGSSVTVQDGGHISIDDEFPTPHTSLSLYVANGTQGISVATESTTAPNPVGVFAVVGTSAAASSLTGFYANRNYVSGGGSATNNYGVFIADQHGVSATANYALKIADQGTGGNDTAISVDGGRNDLGPNNTRIGSLTFAGPGSALPPIYANNAAAITGGLGAGDVYRSGADPDVLCIVH